MSNDALLVLDCLFSAIWSLFTSWCIPGTNVTPAAFFFFLAAASVGLTYVLRTLGGGGGVSVTGAVASSRTVGKGFAGQSSRNSGRNGHSPNSV